MQNPLSSRLAHSFPINEIGDFKVVPHSPIELPDRWVASSLLQKAIRRGQVSLAISAVSYLQHSGSSNLWRKLNVIAWEDVSFGDTVGCLAVSSLSSSSRLREKLGGNDHCIKWAVTRLANSAKCRITDDLVTVLEHDAASVNLIRQLSGMPENDLRSIAWASDRNQVHRAVAVWLLMGTDRFPSTAMPLREGAVDRFFEFPGMTEFPAQLRREGAKLSRGTNTIFPALVAALWPDWTDDQTSQETSDELVWSEIVRGVPAYVFDGHTARGSHYLRRLAEHDAELAWWLNSSLAPELHKPALKKLCFRTVSAQCNKRLAWRPAERIRAVAGAVGFRLSKESFQEGLSLFRNASAKLPIWELG